MSPRRDNRAKLVSPDGTMGKQLVTNRGQWKASSGVGGDKEGPEKCQRKGDKERKRHRGSREMTLGDDLKVSPDPQVAPDATLDDCPKNFGEGSWEKEADGVQMCTHLCSL